MVFVRNSAVWSRVCPPADAFASSATSDYGCVGVLDRVATGARVDQSNLNRHCLRCSDLLVVERRSFHDNACTLEREEARSNNSIRATGTESEAPMAKKYLSRGLFLDLLLADDSQAAQQIGWWRRQVL